MLVRDSLKIKKANTEAIIGKLDKLLYEVRKILQPVKGKSYFVFHDAYQYFEKRFGISTAGFITTAPEGAVGARRRLHAFCCWRIRSLIIIIFHWQTLLGAV